MPNMKAQQQPAPDEAGSHAVQSKDFRHLRRRVRSGPGEMTQSQKPFLARSPKGRPGIPADVRAPVRY